MAKKLGLLFLFTWITINARGPFFSLRGVFIMGGVEYSIMEAFHGRLEVGFANYLNSCVRRRRFDYFGLDMTSGTQYHYLGANYKFSPIGLRSFSRQVHVLTFINIGAGYEEYNHFNEIGSDPNICVKTGIGGLFIYSPNRTSKYVFKLEVNYHFSQYMSRFNYLPIYINLTVGIPLKQLKFKKEPYVIEPSPGKIRFLSI